MFKTIFLPVAVVILLTLGQLGFKKIGLKIRTINSLDSFTPIVMPFMLTLIIYALATLLWIYILSYMPLAKAFSYYALVFIFVPMMSIYYFDEALNLSNLIIGTVLIVSGVLIVNA